MQDNIHQRHAHPLHLSRALFTSLLLSFWLSPLVSAQAVAIRAHLFDANPPSTQAAFTYFLNESREGQVEEWNSRFVDAEGRDFVREKILLDGGQLQHYTLQQPVLDEAANVKVTPQGVIFRYLRGGQWRERFEPTTERVIAGPQIVQTILSQWDALVSGRVYRVRFAVPDRMETLGFRFVHAHSDDKHTVFHFTLSNFVLRQFISPVVLTFDTKSKKIVSLSGRTFLKKRVGNDWAPFTGVMRFL